MSIPPALTSRNHTSSRPRSSRRFPANAQYRLPSHETSVATTTEIAFAVSGLCPSTSPGPNRRRFMSPTSTTNATPPTAPNLRTSTAWWRHLSQRPPAAATAPTAARSALVAGRVPWDEVTAPAYRAVGSRTVGAVVAVVGGGQLARMMQQAAIGLDVRLRVLVEADRKSTRLNSSHVKISYAVFCLKKKK